jgi:hypothetical protein
MKRGQITLFIIVGIVILLVLGLGITAWKYFALERPPEEKIVEETNSEVAPLRDFIKECLTSSGKHVFEEIGLHGGYYNPQDYGFVAIPGQPTNGRAFEPFPGQVLPYWTYVSTANSCLDCHVASEQPPLEGDVAPAVQFQAQQAITEEFTQCIADFEGFRNEFGIEAQSDPVVHIAFSEADTIATLTYVLRVQTPAGATVTMDDFTVQLGVPFKRAYTAAEQVRIASDVSHFFEGLTIETITLTAAGDPEPIPPPAGVTENSYDPGPFWTLQETTERVSLALESAVGIVQLFGSIDMDYVDTDDAEADAQYANYYFGISDPAPRVRANFLYLSSWEPYVRVHPGSQVIRPNMFSTGLPFLPPLKTKDFDYDVSYPVLVQLQVPTATDSYFFQFPIEVNMRNSNPLEYDPVLTLEPSTSFCDPSTWSGSTVAITVQDATGQPLAATVRYDCVSQSCSLGTVNGKLETQLPECIGGSLVAEKNGYVPAEEALESAADETAAVTLELTQFTTVTVEPVLYVAQKEAYTQNGEVKTRWSVGTQNEFTVDNTQKLIVLFTPKDNPDLTQVAIFPDGKATVDLYPGLYDVTAVLTATTATQHVIPAETRCYEAGGLTGLFSDEHCVDIPAIPLGGGDLTDPDTGETIPAENVMYLGGLQWDDATEPLELTQADLDGGNIRIPVVAINIAQITVVEDLDVFDRIDDFSKELK